jgi:hypothetical protein
MSARLSTTSCIGIAARISEPEPYVREEVLEAQFTAMSKRICLSEEVLQWVIQALREGHQDEKKFHEDAVARLQREPKRIQDRIDAMYMDKLDGRIESDFFDRNAVKFRAQQARIMADTESHQKANRSYIEDGIRLLNLA